MVHSVNILRHDCGSFDATLKAVRSYFPILVIDMDFLNFAYLLPSL